MSDDTSTATASRLPERHEHGRGIDWRAALKAALLAFAVSRLLVLLSAGLAVAVAQQWSGNDGHETLRLFDAASRASLEQRTLANDASWYLSIIQSGYEARPFDASQQANWAFFPLHPMLWGSLVHLGVAPALGGILLAHLLLLAGLFQLHRWVQLVRDRASADRAVFCVALFPTAYFFSLPWTESLFLLLSASALLAIARRQWGRASAWGALLSATRPTGALMAALLWWEGRDGRRLPSPRIWLFAALAGTGLLLFMGWLWLKTGNPLAFADIQSAWGRDGGSLTKHFRRWVADPLLIADPWNLRWINNSALLLALAAAVWLWRTGQRGLALLTFFTVLAPWSTGTLVSMGRYVLTCLPVFLALACWLRHPWLAMSWLLISAFALSVMSAWFALGLSFAGA
ncbi:hypothetical protein [Luteimonas abyssi]|uniref:hypothetical protein n=1 Tax=Luteimonas abyssi TaxID=1247514 RepID=UPI000737D1D3|nr:hypothetical protein [Luteimonas abyssi]